MCLSKSARLAGSVDGFEDDLPHQTLYDTTHLRLASRVASTATDANIIMTIKSINPTLFAPWLALITAHAGERNFSTLLGAHAWGAREVSCIVV